MSSRTGLRLQLMREQTMQPQFQDEERAEGGGGAVHVRLANTLPSNQTSATAASKTSPIIIQHPIKFSGNKLVHLPPQIIHVQKQGEDGPSRSVVLGGSVPANLAHLSHATPPRHAARQSGYQQGSRASPAELSPPGYTDSPQSASYTSAHSEMDDIIIDEVLSLEDDLFRRRNERVPGLANSYSFADSLAGSVAGGGGGGGGRHGYATPHPYQRQVSSSAPTPVINLDELVKQEASRDHDFVRDRRKKDVHNMIERRRRYNINDRIKELGHLLPRYASEFSDSKLNKGTILKSSVDYIKTLQKDKDRLMRVQQQNSSLQAQRQNDLQRIVELEQTLAAHGLPVPLPSVQVDAPQCMRAAHRLIKAELPDDTVSPSGSLPTFGLATGPSPGIADLSASAAALMLSGEQDLDARRQAPLPAVTQADALLETPPVLPARAAPPLQMAQMRDLMMDLNEGVLGGGPLLGPQDPMLSGPSADGRPSPDVQWDAAAFSPDAEQNQTAGQMDLS